MNILENIKYYAATSESRIAIKSGDSVLTYKQLEEYSNRLAAWINRNLSSNKVPIVVYGHKNPYMVVCFLACVKSKGLLSTGHIHTGYKSYGYGRVC